MNKESMFSKLLGNCTYLLYMSRRAHIRHGFFAVRLLMSVVPVGKVQFRPSQTPSGLYMGRILGIGQTPKP